MYVCRVFVTKYPYSFKQGNYYPNPIRIRENYRYLQNIYCRTFYVGRTTLTAHRHIVYMK